MTAFGEAQHPEVEEVLPLEEVLAFRDEILIPSIDFLARKDFVLNAEPRSSFIHEETIVTGGIIRRVQAKAFVTLEYPVGQIEGEQARICSISVSTETPRPELTDVLVERAMTQQSDTEIDGNEQGILCAWEVRRHYFDIPEEPGDVPEARTHLELQDLEENVIWDQEDDESELCDDEDGFHSAEERSSFDELIKNFPIGLKKADLVNIQLALIDLGVDFEIVFPGALPGKIL